MANFRFEDLELSKPLIGSVVNVLTSEAFSLQSYFQTTLANVEVDDDPEKTIIIP